LLYIAKGVKVGFLIDVIATEIVVSVSNARRRMAIWSVFWSASFSMS
jgi:hypothetical protein